MILCASCARLAGDGGDKSPPLVLACEQAGARIVLLDSARDWSDPGAIVWAWSAKDDPAIPEDHVAWFSFPSDAKRVLGGEFVLTVASGGGVALISVADRSAAWHAYAGGNPHSADVLPDGNIVVASSTGDFIALFARATGANSDPVKLPFRFTHGACWDAERERLWVVGLEDLASYRYVGGPEAPSLVEETRFRLPEDDGHDLFPIPGTEKLWITTHSRIWTFDVEDEEFTPYAPLPEAESVKSVSMAGPDGRVMMMRAEEQWWSDSAWFPLEGRKNTLPGARFYKVRWWVPNRFGYGHEDK